MRPEELYLTDIVEASDAIARSLSELEHQLSVLLGVKVDLVMKDALKPTIGKRILQEVVPI